MEKLNTAGELGANEAPAFDVDQKRDELLTLWSDVFDICKDLVSAAKQGDLTMRASLLKEIVAYLKMSSDVLDKAAERHQEEEQEVDNSDEEAALMEEFAELEKDIYGTRNPQAEPLL